MTVTVYCRDPIIVGVPEINPLTAENVNPVSALTSGDILNVFIPYPADFIVTGVKLVIAVSLANE